MTYLNPSMSIFAPLDTKRIFVETLKTRGMLNMLSMFGDPSGCIEDVLGEIQRQKDKDLTYLAFSCFEHFDNRHCTFPHVS